MSTLYCASATPLNKTPLAMATSAGDNRGATMVRVCGGPPAGRVEWSSRRKENKVKSNIQKDKTMRSENYPKESPEHVGSPLRRLVPTLQEGRRLKRQWLQTALLWRQAAQKVGSSVRQPQIYAGIYSSDQQWPGFSSLVVFFPRLRNPTSLRPQRQPRVSPATFGNPVVAKNQGPSVEKSFQKADESRASSSSRCRFFLVKTCSEDAGEAKWSRD